MTGGPDQVLAGVNAAFRFEPRLQFAEVRIGRLGDCGLEPVGPGLPRATSIAGGLGRDLPGLATLLFDSPDPGLGDTKSIGDVPRPAAGVAGGQHIASELL
jgi:hypothetical protein